MGCHNVWYLMYSTTVALRKSCHSFKGRLAGSPQSSSKTCIAGVGSSKGFLPQLCVFWDPDHSC